MNTNSMEKVLVTGGTVFDCALAIMENKSENHIFNLGNKKAISICEWV